MAGINIELPAFEAEDLNDAKTRQKIISYLYRLAEQVKYLSANIDADNVTDEFSAEIASKASAQAKDEISGVLTEYETKIEQNAREISTKASKTEVDALGNEIGSVESSLTQTASSLTAKITKAQNTANSANKAAGDAKERVASLELTLDGVVASIDNNRLAFTAKGLTIKNADGQTVFSQDNNTGNLTITGTINASGGTVGGFTIGTNSITGPNGVELFSTGDSSIVNNIKLRSGADEFGNGYTLITPSNENGYSELRLGMFSYLSQEGVRLYAQDGQLRMQVSYYLYSTGGAYFLNLPTISGVKSNLYLDAGGQLHRIV
ncbi:MAG: hypothetical protein E7335_00205 [Clostridiales bacterium]|nr:hypothetical protein [Clostridiales bacterium]